MERFPPGRDFSLGKVTSSHFSNGIIPRVRAILEAHRHAVDVNHVTGEVHYLALGLPGNRTVLTVHDCGFMTHPNPVLRRLLKWFWLDWPVRHSRYVTAVSEATKADIVRYTGCRSDKVVVIPTVIAETFQRSDKTFDEACPRILHIGMAPNKNFERHVAAISGLRCRLHIVGKLCDAHVRLLEMHDITYTAEHNVSRAEVFRAYRECDLLLFASTREGFGMPILERSRWGVPSLPAIFCPCRRWREMAPVWSIPSMSIRFGRGWIESSLMSDSVPIWSAPGSTTPVASAPIRWPVSMNRFTGGW